VTLGYDVCAVFGGCGERRRDGDVGDDFAHDGVDGWVQTEGFADDGIEEGEVLEFVVGEVTEFAFFASAEVFDLFLVQSLTANI
jgi:hypothetical protein